MTGPLRILAADAEPSSRRLYEDLLASQGHHVITATGADELLELCNNLQAELIITSAALHDGMLPDRTVPLILVAEQNAAELHAHARHPNVMALLVKPLSPGELLVAVEFAVLRFQHLQKLHKEVTDLRQALADRKLIEQAKGIVMRRLRFEESQAFTAMQQLARTRNCKLAEMAQRIIAADEIYKTLETAMLPASLGSARRLHGRHAAANRMRSNPCNSQAERCAAPALVKSDGIER